MNIKLGAVTTGTIIEDARAYVPVKITAAKIRINDAATRKMIERERRKIVWNQATQWTDRLDSHGLPFHRHRMPSPKYPGGWVESAPETRHMSDARFHEISAARIRCRGGIWNIGKPYTDFEKAAIAEIMKGKDSWSFIPWEKVLVQTDDKGDGYLLQCCKNKRIDELKKKRVVEVSLEAIFITKVKVPNRGHSDEGKYSNDVKGLEYAMPEAPHREIGMDRKLSPKDRLLPKPQAWVFWGGTPKEKLIVDSIPSKSTGLLCFTLNPNVEIRLYNGTGKRQPWLFRENRK